MKLLLHQCCGPCSVYPVERLLEEGISVYGFFYNPNIHPFTEYKKRLDTLVEFNKSRNIEYIVIDEYGLRPFIDMAMNSGNRCISCYETRLYFTAKYAADNGFDALSTTLLYSRRQKHDDIRKIAEEAASLNNVALHYEDYRKGWQVGIELSKQMGMYRQNYCGCIFSEEERYLNIRAVE